MTNNDLIALSKQVAKAYKLYESADIILEYASDGEPVLMDAWLHEDSARCFDLMCEHGIWAVGTHNVAESRFWIDGVMYQIFEVAKHHNNDKSLATRVAILKALVKVKE